MFEVSSVASVNDRAQSHRLTAIDFPKNMRRHYSPDELGLFHVLGTLQEEQDSFTEFVGLFFGIELPCEVSPLIDRKGR